MTAASALRRFWPFRHLGLKVLAVSIAVILWMLVSGEQTVERVVRAPVQFEQFPSALELRGDVPATVDVRVRGASGQLSRIAPSDVVIDVDLEGAKAGRRFVQLSAEQVRGPVGVEVVQVSPSMLTLLLENSASRIVPVVADVVGAPAPGFEAGRPILDPPAIEIVGPEGAVKRATEAVTEQISVAGARDNVSETVSVGLQDNSLRLKNPRPIRVTVPIVPASR